MDRPWDRLSREQKLLDTQRDCMDSDTGPASRWRSSEGCTAVSDPATAEATGHSAAGCRSAAADIDLRTMMRTRLPVARKHCYSGILLETAAPDRRSAAGHTWADQDTAAVVEAAAAAPAVGILHSDLASIAGRLRGSDWGWAAGIGRLGSKTCCRESGCDRSSRERAT